MIFGFDLDDTSYVWGANKDKALRERYPHLKNFRFGTDQVSWDLYEGLDEEHAAAMTEVMVSQGFYESLEPIEGAVEIAHRLVELGHEVFFVSTPWVTNPWCMNEKYTAIERDYGKGWGKRLILTTDKTLVNVDVLVDDKTKIEGINPSPAWTHVYFDQPHNRNEPGLRIYEWSEESMEFLLSLDSKVLSSC